jgi:hypothetical protein
VNDHPIEAAVIRPGQTLILRVAHNRLTAEIAEHLKAKAAERLPGVDIVIIGGVDQMLVYDPEPQD